VSIEKEQDGVLHASFQSKVKLAKSTNDMVLDAQTLYMGTMEDILSSLGMELHFEQPKRIEVPVEPALEQRWCIS
jgi:hypothetical protein